MRDATGKRVEADEHPVDWTRPDERISERLPGTQRRLARRSRERAGRTSTHVTFPVRTRSPAPTDS